MERYACVTPSLPAACCWVQPFCNLASLSSCPFIRHPRSPVLYLKTYNTLRYITHRLPSRHGACPNLNRRRILLRSHFPVSTQGICKLHLPRAVALRLEIGRASCRERV